MFRLISGIYEQNPALQEMGGFFLTWAAENYVAAASMALRRELDTRAGTESLWHLLCEIRDRPKVISRARFRASWGDQSDPRDADRAFDSFPIVRDVADRERDYLDPATVAADVNTLADQDIVLTHVQTTIAHGAPERPNPRIPTFGEFHGAFETVQEVFTRYYLILTHRVLMTCEPVTQYDIYTPFRSPWITDSEKFDYSRTE